MVLQIYQRLTFVIIIPCCIFRVKPWDPIIIRLLLYKLEKARINEWPFSSRYTDQCG